MVINFVPPTNRLQGEGRESMERKKWSMKDLFKKTRLLLINNKVDSRKLVPGDHIYAYRGMHLYSHHGIYLGNEQVIHFIPTETKPEKVGKHKPCPNCGHQTYKDLGVVKTCLDCFISEGSHFSGHTLRRRQYEVPESWYNTKGAGSCSTSASKSSNEVIEIATSLYKDKDKDNRFRDFNLFNNNCESFATYCKTGKPKSAQVDKVTGTLIKGMIMGLVGFGVYKLVKSASTSNDKETEVNDEDDEDEDEDDDDDDDDDDDEEEDDDDDDDEDEEEECHHS